MKTKLVLFFLATVGLSQASEPARHTITHEDVWLMKRVGAPTVSPDGQWVVFTVTEPAYDPKEQSSDLWLRAVDGDSPPHRITSTRTAETGVQWSPDSRKIVFSAKREGDDVAQLYVLDLATGGEAVRVTALSTGARSPRWSPDGKRLLFLSDVFPAAPDDATNILKAKERKERKYNVRVYETFPVRYWDHWLDEKQTHIFVQDVAPEATPRDLLAGTKLAAAKGFGGHFTEAGEDIETTWTPDGQSILFSATTNRDRAAFSEVNAQLYQLAAEGGEPKPLTADKNDYGSPTFSADGRALFVQVEKGGDGKVYHDVRLGRFSWPMISTNAILLTEKFDRSVSRFAVDAETIYFTAEDEGTEKLYAVSATGGDPRPIGDLTSGCTTNVSVGAGVIIADWESAVSPAEIVQIFPDKNQHRLLSAVNADRVAQLNLTPLESFWFTSARGRKVQNFILKPPGFDPTKKYPVFAVIHGGPHTMFRDAFGVRWNYHLLAAPGYVVLLTNYTGSSGFGEEFAQAIQGDPFKTPGDEINAGIDEAIRRYAFLDTKHLAAGGASYGGHLANWLEATTTRFRCLVAHAGLVNLESQWGTSDSIYSREVNNGGPIWEQGPVWRQQNPVRLAGNHAKKTGWITPMLLSVGEMDFRVPLNNTLENWSYLQRLQIPSKLLVFPEENHWILRGEDSRFWYGQVQDWLARWLK
jgi:dipeptidyl aminopeptidase/acylaminoacyl peptidase